jgi:hypothetical protein
MQTKDQSLTPLDLSEAPAIGHWHDADYTDYAARHSRALKERALSTNPVCPHTARPAELRQAEAVREALAHQGPV